MKAIILKNFGGIENFQMDNVPEPEVKEGTIKVKVKATAFNPIDFQMRKGGNESKLLKSTILGREMSGIVTQVHSSVREFNIGDEVYGYVSNLGSNGTYAGYIVLPKEIVSVKPANLTFSEAAAIPLVGLTAIQSIEKIAPLFDETVFVMGGAGGVGSMIIRLLLKKGITNIYTTAGNPASIASIVSYGFPVSNIFNYNDGDLVANFLKSNNRRKADIVIDTVGGKLSESAAEILKVNGKYADVAFLTTENARSLLFDKGISILNISNYAYGIENDKVKMTYYSKRLNTLRKYLEDGVIRRTPINVVGNLSVETVRTAHAMLEDNQTAGLKLIMDID